VIEGLAGPNLDPIITGHRATARYVRNALVEIGTILRVPARSRQTGGTGLGLSIARHALGRYGGEITASSRLGEGSVFVLSLPAEAEEKS
jgi:light-regulated signal transduction histidine kinase (bacteriophytochrome)